MKMDKTTRLRYGAVVLVLLLVFGGWYAYSASDDRQKPLDVAESTTAAEPTPGTIYVHVAGAVNAPGLIELPAGARVADAIEACGGLTADADGDAVNLAAVLEDADKITIGVKGDVKSPQAGDGLVNLNTADLETLKTLDGVGDVIAQNIIDYREANGGFKSIEELIEVNRIGEKIYENLKDSVTI